MVAKFRVATATKRHKIHLIRDISNYEKTNLIRHEKFVCPIDLSSILPPRRKWIRPHRNQRNRIGTSTDVVVQSIVRTISRTEKLLEWGLLTKAPKWYRNLNVFIEIVRSDTLSGESLKINSPDIIPIEKLKNGQHTGECRPIAMYGYRDRIIIGLCSKYLTDFFEPLFGKIDCSYAFRSRQFTDAKTHHDAIRCILSFKKNNKECLWSSECDIKKFFDCVNHDLLQAIFKKYVLELKRDGRIVDSRAKIIFSAYLNSYSFNDNVDIYNGTQYFENFNIKNGYFKWEKEELIMKYYPSGINGVRLGVPQGGALSCFISNLFLHEVDLDVFRSDKNSFYIRYCDDMIILQKSETECQEALERYCKAIEMKKLLIHTPQEVKYSNEYWGDKGSKSKKPYLWSSLKNNGIPWLAFVGYQIRYDGCIRVRKSSIIKEKDKQKKETERVLRAINYKNKDLLNDNSRKSFPALKFALQQRLISMSAGRTRLNTYKHTDPQMCWTNGFRAITNNQATRNQFRSLDKTRQIQLKRFTESLKKLDKKSDDSDDVKVLKYYGKPYSYYCFLENNIIKRSD